MSRSPTEGFKSVKEMYGPGLKNVSIITLAPELEGSMDAIQGCVDTGILVSLGHTQATLSEVHRTKYCWKSEYSGTHNNVVKKVEFLAQVMILSWPLTFDLWPLTFDL